MTGKEALIHLSKNCKELELEYGNFKISKKDNEALQTLKEIVQKHDKYERAFEVFKGREVQVYPKFDGNTQYLITLNKEEYELLEGLTKNENIQ